MSVLATPLLGVVITAVALLLLNAVICGMYATFAIARLVAALAIAQQVGRFDTVANARVSMSLMACHAFD